MSGGSDSFYLMHVEDARERSARLVSADSLEQARERTGGWNGRDGFDLRALLAERAGDEFETHARVVNPQFVKGWHRHRIMTLNYAVVAGNILLVLYDDREDSATHETLQEIPQGDDHYVLVTVPPGVWNGFKGLGSAPAIVANCATHPHDPLEIERLDPFSNHIPYSWGPVRGGG